MSQHTDAPDLNKLEREALTSEERYAPRCALIQPHLDINRRYALAVAAEYLAQYMESGSGRESLHEDMVRILTFGSKLGGICKELPGGGYVDEEAAEFGVLIANELVTEIVPKLIEKLRSNEIFPGRAYMLAADFEAVQDGVGY